MINKKYMIKSNNQLKDKRVQNAKTERQWLSIIKSNYSFLNLEDPT